MEPLPVDMNVDITINALDGNSERGRAAEREDHKASSTLPERRRPAPAVNDGGQDGDTSAAAGESLVEPLVSAPVAVDQSTDHGSFYSASDLTYVSVARAPRLKQAGITSATGAGDGDSQVARPDDAGAADKPREQDANSLASFSGFSDRTSIDKLPASTLQKRLSSASTYLKRQLSLGLANISNDAVSVLGSRTMLASSSYVGVYRRSYSSLADRLHLPPAAELSDVSTGGGLPFIDEERAEANASRGSGATAPTSAVSAAEPAWSQSEGRAIKRSCYKRMLVLALVFFSVYGPFFSLRNVQGSLTEEPALGLLTLGCIYATTWIGAVCSYPILHLIGPKWTIVCATVPFLLFALSNFYAVSYLVLPTSLMLGFGVGLIWAAEGLYLINTASTFSVVAGLPQGKAIDRLNTIFYVFYLLSDVVGNGLSTLILRSSFPGEEHHSVPTFVLPGNNSLATGSTAEAATATAAQYSDVADPRCGIQFDFAHTAGPSSITAAQKYTLVSVMTIMAAAGTLLSAFTLDKLDSAHLTGSKNVLVNFVDMVKNTLDPRMLLLVPMFVYFGFSGSLIFGDYAQAFISCAHGPSYIGLVFLVGASLGVIGSFVGGIAGHLLGRTVTMVCAAVLAIGAYITMLLWTPGAEVSPILFLPVALWCFTDGVLAAQINGLQGILFQEKYPSSCASCLIFYGCSVAIGSIMTAFEWMTVQSKTYAVLGMNAAALIAYIILEVLLRIGPLRQR